jgi:hypothetical protein
MIYKERDFRRVVLKKLSRNLGVKLDNVMLTADLNDKIDKAAEALSNYAEKLMASAKAKEDLRYHKGKFVFITMMLIFAGLAAFVVGLAVTVPAIFIIYRRWYLRKLPDFEERIKVTTKDAEEAGRIYDKVFSDVEESLRKYLKLSHETT